MAETIRGDGLSMAAGALTALVEDPRRLENARRRFNDPPPSYTSRQSHNSTRSQSPDPPSEEQQRHEERKWQLKREREASLPYWQFDAQTNEERQRIIEANENRTHRVPVGTDFYKLAHENVRNHWVEQGIWNHMWDDMASGPWKWKHEESLELETESEADSRAEPKVRIFSFARKRAVAKPRRQKSDEEKRRLVEPRATRERKREASRPFHQFVYQISKEREQIQAGSRSGEATTTATAIPDINTKAYENVKSTWIKRGIWDGRWGILPGMSWKHEDPLEEETGDGSAAVQANTFGNGANGTGEAPSRGILRSTSPVESGRHQAPGIMNTSQQQLPAGVDLTGLRNGDAESFPLASNSPQHRSRPGLRSPTRQTPRRSKRKPSQENEHTHQLSSTPLGLVHSSKVAKTARKKSPGRRRRPNIAQEVSSVGPATPSRPDIAEPPLQTASIYPRRSKRIRPPEPSADMDLTGTASTDPPKVLGQSRPRRIIAGNPKSISPAKPQGISRRQRSNATRRKARKDDK